MSTVVRRPVWKQYPVAKLAGAVAWAKRGGGAIVRSDDGALRLLFPLNERADIPELFFWAILDLEKRKWSRVKEGLDRGLGSSLVPRRKHWVIETWVERDLREKETFRDVTLDCLTCAACCEESRVFLLPDDLLLWKRAGRPELGKPPYVYKDKGRPMLKMRPDTRCQHLNGNACGIYKLRPFNCRAFPAGSEPCLAAREQKFGPDHAD